MIITLNILNILNCLNSLQNPSKDSMLIIQPGCRNSSNKELTSISIRPSIGHAQSKGSIMLKSIMKLILKFSSPNTLTSSTIPIRTSSLYHEPFNNSMESQSNIITLLSQSYKILHCLTHFLSKQSNVNITHSRLNYRILSQTQMILLHLYDLLILLIRFLIENISTLFFLHYVHIIISIAFVYLHIFWFSSTKDIEPMFLKS
jgi:hypothetical protein